MSIIQTICYFILLAMPFKLFAWGPIGHRAVGYIAEKHLSQTARTQIKKIIPEESLASCATWPDEIKSQKEYSHTFDMHFINWEGNKRAKELESPEHVNILSSIKKLIVELKNNKLSSEKKQFNLRFLVHLIGDLHQPLHVGFASDMGGNTCEVYWFGKKTNLHNVWDYQMLQLTELSYTELGDILMLRSVDKSWTKTEPYDWALESKILKDTVYPSPELERKYCNSKHQMKNNQLPKLGYEYAYAFKPVYEKRILQAGIRLAHLLNEIYK